MPLSLPGIVGPRSPAGGAGRVALACLLALTFTACSNLEPVRDFSRSAASLATGYPLAASAYVDSAVTSAPYRLNDAAVVPRPPPAALAGSAPADATPPTATPALATPALATLADAAAAQSPGNRLRLQRQQQVEVATGLEALLTEYFQTLARLAGDDPVSIATAKAVAADWKSVAGGSLDRTTLDAAAGLLGTLGEFSLLPARESAVRSLVRAGGPDAMRLLAALRGVAADWRAQVANDGLQVADTLGTAVLASDVPPLLRLLANDRQAELARSYATTLRRMSSELAAIDLVAATHRDLTEHLGDLHDAAVRQRLTTAAAALRASRSAQPFEFSSSLP